LEENEVDCPVSSSHLQAGAPYCPSCGAGVPEPRPSADIRNRIVGERKYLTVLCADLQRSTDLISELDPESAITRLEPALNAMRLAVRRNRGIVSKEGGDGLIALFGAPHADDHHAIMACQAGIELVRRITLLDDPALQVRVGIHSGYVVTQLIEADLSSIYEAGGPAVHLVKRLEGAAQAGQILVSESCQKLSSGLAVFNVLPPKRLEGFVAPVPCYELGEISGLTRWRARLTKGLSSFVGRIEEMLQLQRAAEDVGASGQVIALVGTAGIGKSRMAQRFVADLRRQNWQVIEADGNPLEQAVPFALSKKLLQSALATGSLAPAEAGAVSMEKPRPHAQLWSAALEAVLDRPISDPRWGELEPLLRRRAMGDAVLNAIDRVIGTRPSVLLLEDLHWIDSQSEAVVEAIMSLAGRRPVLVVLTWRTENTPGWLARLDVRRIWLRSLDAASAKALVDDMLGPGAYLEDLKGHVLRHTGQVPLFIEEVARQLIERGLPGAGSPPSEARASWRALEIPPTVQGVIASRIDRLPKEDKTLLQLAAAIGPRVSPQLLTAVTGMPMVHLQSRLWSLEILDFLVESRLLASIEYEFAHELIRDVAYDSILRSQRGELHRRILIAMEASASGREEEVAEALCQHALKAQEWAKADQYGHMAARKAYARSAFRNAAEYFQIAMDAVDRQAVSTSREQRAIDLRIESRVVFGPFGKMEEWFSLCRDAEARSEKLEDEGRRLASIAMRAAALNFYGTPYEGIAAGEEALALADRLANGTWLGFVEFGLGQSYFLAGRFREAEQWLERARARFAGMPNEVPPGTTASSLLVLCHMMKSIVYVWMGEFEASEKCADDARRLAKAKGRPYDLTVASYAHGVLEQWRGNLPRAEEELGQALHLARENELRQFLPLVMGSLGNVLTQMDHAADAEKLLLTARKEAEALGHQSSIVVIPAYLSSAYAELGEQTQAVSLARACRAGARQKGYTGIEALAALAEANSLAAKGTGSEEAIECFKQVIELAARIDARPLLGLAREALGRLLAASGRTTEAQEQLLQAIALFDRSKMTVQLESARNALAKV